MGEVNEIIQNPYGFIYITTNMVNGMKYLGQKSFDDNYKWPNYLGSGKVFKNALKKYGKENFSRNIVCFCDSLEELNQTEYELSVFLDVVESPGWYNLCYGGGVPSGYVITDETRSKMSEAQKARWTDELRQELSEKMSGDGNPFYGKHHSEEVRLKLSEQHIGMKVSDEVKKKISEANKERYKDENERAKCGRPHTDKWKQEQSERMKGENHPMYGRHHSEETKRKISEAHKNLSDEARKNISDAAKARCTDEWIERMRKINTGKKLTEEHKRKLSESNKGKKMSEEAIRKRLKTIGVTKIIQYDKCGNFIQLWDSAKNIENTLHISSSKIYACCNKRRNHAGGFVWRKESEPLTTDEINALQEANKNRHEGISWYKASNKWMVYITINGKQKYIGYFDNWDDALKARLDAENNIIQQNDCEGDMDAKNIESKD